MRPNHAARAHTHGQLERLLVQRAMVDTNGQVDDVDQLEQWFMEFIRHNRSMLEIAIEEETGIDTYHRQDSRRVMRSFAADDFLVESVRAAPKPAEHNSPARAQSTASTPKSSPPNSARVRASAVSSFRRAGSSMDLSQTVRTMSTLQARVQSTFLSLLSNKRKSTVGAASMVQSSTMTPAARRWHWACEKLKSMRVDKAMPLALIQSPMPTPGPSGAFAAPPKKNAWSASSPAQEHTLGEPDHGVASPSMGQRLRNALQKGKNGADDHADSGAVHHEELSVLEMKALLQQHKFYTPEQIDKEVWTERSSIVEVVTTLGYFVMILFTAFTVAARIGLESHRLSPSLAWCELAIDVTWLIVILVIRLGLPVEDAGHFIFDTKMIALRYATNPKGLLFDLISNFPVLAVLAPAGLQDFTFARVNLLLREAKMPHLLEHLEQHLPSSLHPSVYRLIGYAFYLILMITHLQTIFMWVLRTESDHAIEHWFEVEAAVLDHDTWFWFSRSWRDTLTLVAEKRFPYPHEDAEYIASLFIVIVGLATISVILASFEEIIVEEINEGNHLNKKLDEVMSYLDHRGVPEEMKTEIVDYYREMWEINRTFDFNEADDLLADLPTSLYRDIESECNAQIIRKIPLFAEVAQNKDFVRLLAGKLQQIVIMPGGHIVAKGDDGNCMFFLNSGVASVRTPDGAGEIEQLNAGAFFGEKTMLFGGQRECDIVAKTLCVCSIVTDEQFERVVDRFPEVLESILTAATVRRVKEPEIAAAAAMTASMLHTASGELADA